MSAAEISQRRAKKLEAMYVHYVYSSQALSYDDLCDGPWPEIENFLSKLPRGSLVADVGCGNGKYLNIRDDIIVNGSDVCNELTQLAYNRHKDVIRATNLRLPYRSDSMDAVISVGVLHHIASSQRRLRCVLELSRILRPGGKMLVYVWAWEQKKRKFKSQDVLIPWTNVKLKESEGGGDHDPSSHDESREYFRCFSNGKTDIQTESSAENGVGNLREPASTRGTSKLPSDDKLALALKTSNLYTDGGWCQESEDFELSSIEKSMKKIPISSRKKQQLFSFAKSDCTTDRDHLHKNCCTCKDEGHCTYCTKNNGQPANNRSKLYNKEFLHDKTTMAVNGRIFNNDNSGTSLQAKSFYRFYHVFRKDELLELVNSAPDLDVVSQNYIHGNWAVIAEKRYI